MKISGAKFGNVKYYSYVYYVIMIKTLKDMIYLESVGSYLDPKEGIIYPAFETNEPDMDCPISLVEDEVASDWWDALSPTEWELCKAWY